MQNMLVLQVLAYKWNNGDGIKYFHTQANLRNYHYLKKK